MPRDIVEPTLDEYGQEQHPAWALIGASRVQSGPPGATLFDSELQHHHYVTVTLSRAVRERSLNHDHIFPKREVIEVAMSEAQWASFVSSMNVGNGVPCTVLYEQGTGQVPGMPYAPRMAESMAEVRDAADRSLEKIREAFTQYAEHKTKANLRNLEIVLQNATPNMAFAARSLAEHAENTVQKARADVEAMVLSKAQQLGIDPAELGQTLRLPEHTDDDRPQEG